MAGEVKVAIAGATGRMGRALLEVIRLHPSLKLVGAWEKSGHAGTGSNLGAVTGTDSGDVNLLDDPVEAMKDADVAIDFTTPASTLANLEAAARSKTAMIIGTTGMNADELKKVEVFSKTRPVVMASNFSIGVNVMLKAAAMIAAVTGDDYDIEIVDVHHNRKKDSPSGTAVTLLQTLATARGKHVDEVATYGRHGRDDERARGEIGVHALRAGDVVGDHTVYFAGPWERLELVHRSHSRQNFANGALRAAAWVAGKKHGLFSMADVLDFG